ncbi:hypothetical protein [Mycetocola manganoxydans]|uniref:hypothetical protein n=1 Tax=Mycetocola manganoxydans TaxID=699879 RepID=UPI001600E43C|nr:hypothetical protein [Mycetocola manganoxydans]GHD52452.1 hypothetical protein GCM10008097_28380 [Mycetocola manganoxydans]
MKARLIASVVLAATVVLGTSACNLVAPQATTKNYDPSDGVSGRVGDLKIRNALIIMGEEGTDGNLIASVTNGGSAQSLDIQFGEGEDGTVTVKVPEESTVSFGTAEDEPILLAGVDALPGSLTTVFFQYGDETGVEILVPVLDGSLPEYSDLVPSPPVPIRSASPTSTPEATPEGE